MLTLKVTVPRLKVPLRSFIFVPDVDNIPVSALKILLRHPNIDVNVQTSDGNTALHYACIFLDPAKARALLESGANPEIVNSEGDTPISLLRWYHTQIALSEETRREAGDILSYLENSPNAAAGNNAS